MKTVVVYFTKFGNTRKVAEAIAGRLADAGEARALSFEELTASDLEEADLVVMGSPTHYQNLPKEVRAVLDTLPRKCLAGKKVAAFDTSVETWGPLMRMTAAHRLRSKLRKLGGKPIAKAETFLVERGTSPEDEEVRQDALLEGELERAPAWAEMLLQALEA